MKQLETFYKGTHISFYTKFRFLLGGWVRGEMREIYWNYEKWKKKEKDIDYLVASVANQIHTPSLSLGDIVSKEWGLPRDKILQIAVSCHRLAATCRIRREYFLPSPRGFAREWPIGR